jgi:hypothetical protein
MARPPGMENLPPMHHQTISAIDCHQLNSQGLPELHTVTQRIIAVEDMDRVPFIIDAGQADIVGVDAIDGCQAGDPYTVDKYQVVDIRLGHTLSAGGEAELTYSTRLNYKKAPPPEFLRRVGRSGMRYLDVTVLFAADKLPSEVWWNRYQDVGASHPSIVPVGPAVYMAPHEIISGENTGMREVQYVEEELSEGTILGFRWKWPK